MAPAGDQLDHVSFAVSNDEADVGLLFQNGVTANQKLPRGRNALFSISDHNRASALVSAGADVNCVDDDGNTPLHFAANGSFGNEFDPKFDKVAQVYLTAGARQMTNKIGLTPIHLAAKGFDGGKWIPLLIAAGGSPNSRSNDGNYPLLDAYDKEAAIALIVGGADVTVRTKNGGTILHHLHKMTRYSSRDAQIDLLNKAVSFGVDVNAQDNDGNTTLHIAVGATDYEFDGPEFIRALLKNGADPLITNKRRENSVDLARTDTVRTLFSHFLETSQQQRLNEEAHERVYEQEARARANAASAAGVPSGGRITELEIKRQRALASLGLEDTATAEEIVKQYHKLAQIFHTDKTQHLSERDRDTATVQFQKVADAFQFLRDLGR